MSAQLDLIKDPYPGLPRQQVSLSMELPPDFYTPVTAEWLDIFFERQTRDECKRAGFVLYGKIELSFYYDLSPRELQLGKPPHLTLLHDIIGHRIMKGVVFSGQFPQTKELSDVASISMSTRLVENYPRVMVIVRGYEHDIWRDSSE